MVRTRFAPSPTGFLHLGSLRTALYAYALAKHSQGDFILRIEDTDQKREVTGAVDALKTTLKKFSIHWDEFYVQSERLDLYKSAAQKLVKNGHAFYCGCIGKNAKEDGFSTVLKDPCRDKNLTSGAIKLKVPPGEKLTYHDFVHRKDISWDSDTVYDAVLLKSDGFPTYHLAVAVDDLDMRVSHIIRGHDWLPSTPIHILVFKYLGGDIPQIGHVTDILSGATGKKLSKRRDSVFVEQYLEQGYLPDALLNFLMLLGWAPKDNREVFSLKEFVEHFDINGFQEANPVFNITKLNWFNGYYLRQKSDEELVNLVQPFFPTAGSDLLKKIIPLAKERVSTLQDFSSLCEFFISPPKSQSLNSDHLDLAKTVLTSVDWSKDAIDSEFMPKIKERGWKVGDFFMTLRLAITGSKVTPPLTESMLILGRSETLSRINSSLDASR
jgi:glutamyl-tRNA synthetase